MYILEFRRLNIEFLTRRLMLQDAPTFFHILNHINIEMPNYARIVDENNSCIVPVNQNHTTNVATSCIFADTHASWTLPFLDALNWIAYVELWPFYVTNLTYLLSQDWATRRIVNVQLQPRPFIWFTEHVTPIWETYGKALVAALNYLKHKTLPEDTAHVKIECYSPTLPNRLPHYVFLKKNGRPPVGYEDTYRPY